MGLQLLFLSLSLAFFLVKLSPIAIIKYNFKSKIRGTDPRPGKQYSPTIELNCTLEYKI